MIHARRRPPEYDEHRTGGIETQADFSATISLAPDGRGFNNAGIGMPKFGNFSSHAEGAISGIKLPPLFSLPGARAEPPMLLTTTSTSSNNSSQASEEKPVTYVLGETELNNYHLVKIAVVAKG